MPGQETREKIAEYFWVRHSGSYSCDAYKYYWHNAPENLKKFAYCDAADILALFEEWAKEAGYVKLADDQIINQEISDLIGKIVREK